MRGAVKRTAGAKRTRRANKMAAELSQSPPPPFLSLCRGFVCEPETTILDVSVRLPLQHISNRVAVHNAVLRSVLHRLHAVPSTTTTSSSSTMYDAAGVAYRTLIHVDSIHIHADSARQVYHSGEVRLRATVAAVLARVEHGVLVGVAESSQFTDTMVVRLHRGDSHDSSHPPPEKREKQKEKKEEEDEDSTSKNDTDDNDNSGDKHRNSNRDDASLLVTARCLEEEPVVVGQVVLLVSEPGTLRCLAIRPPRKAPGPFKLHIADGVAEIQASWPTKSKANTLTAVGPPSGM